MKKWQFFFYQVVTYYVNGDSGFVADVKYIGEAKYGKKPPHQQYWAF